MRNVWKIIKIIFSILRYIITIPFKLVESILIGGPAFLLFLFFFLLEIAIPLAVALFVYIIRFAPTYVNHDMTADKTIEETLRYSWEAITQGFIPASLYSFKYHSIPVLFFCTLIFLALSIAIKVILCMRFEETSVRYFWQNAKANAEDISYIWSLESVKNAIRTFKSRSLNDL